MRRSLALAIAALLGASPAAAQPNQPVSEHPNKAAANDAFQEAKRLMEKKNVRAACLKFEESQRLLEQLGTRLNLAVCYVQLGKLVAARDTFRVAETTAVRTKDPRLPFIRGWLVSLDPRIAYLTITLAPGIDRASIDVTRNGQAVPRKALGTPVPIDPGEHVIRAASPGAEDWSVRVSVAESSRRIVEVPPLRPVVATETPRRPAPTEPGRAPTPSSARPVAGPTADPTQPDTTLSLAPSESLVDTGTSRRTRQLISLGIGGAGLVALGTGVYIGLGARSDWQSLVDGDRCTSNGSCEMEALPEARSARNRSIAANIVGGVGLATIAAGASLYVFWARRADEEVEPAASAHLAPVLGPGLTGVALTGAF